MQHLLHLSFSLFILGLAGLFLFRRNFIMLLVALEVIFLALNLNFIFFSIYLDDILGQLFSIFILTIAGAESSIGLALLVVYHKMTGIVSISKLVRLNG